MALTENISKINSKLIENNYITFRKYFAGLWDYYDISDFWSKAIIACLVAYFNNFIFMTAVYYSKWNSSNISGIYSENMCQKTMLSERSKI